MILIIVYLLYYSNLKKTKPKKNRKILFLFLIPEMIRICTAEDRKVATV